VPISVGSSVLGNKTSQCAISIVIFTKADTSWGRLVSVVTSYSLDD
jgi:hypothetical protein